MSQMVKTICDIFFKQQPAYTKVFVHFLIKHISVAYPKDSGNSSAKYKT